MTLLIVLFGLGLNIFGSSFYLLEMVKGRAKPNRVTSALWTLEGIIALSAAWVDGVTWVLVPALVAFFGPFTALVLSFILKQAYWEVTFFDKVCGVFSLLAIVLCQQTGNPNIAILFAILAEAFAALPTITKAWRFPETEAFLSYAVAVPGYATCFLVLEKYSFSEIAYPLWGMLICAIIAVLIATGPVRLRRPVLAP